jgi:ABC-type phosphate transport system auxiliary subunit
VSTTKQLRELALSAASAEALTPVEELQKEAEGCRRRILIIDSQIEALREVTKRLEVVAAIWAGQLSTIVNLDRLDIDLKRLNARILEEGMPLQDRGKAYGRVKVTFNRGQGNGP